MAGRQSRGRQRIPMRLIESQDDLYATFSKRRRGLYKKASEISTLCDADVGLIIFSPTNNPFSFWHPTLESVIGRYRNPNQPLDDHTRFVEANTRDTIQYCNMRLDEVLDEKEGMKERVKMLNEANMTREKGWWEQTSIEDLNKEQVKEWKAQFEDCNAKVKRRIEELRNGASSSMAVQQQMIGPSNPPPMGTMVWPSQFHGQYYNAPPPQVNLPYVGGVPSHDQFQYYPSSTARLPSIGDVGPGGNDFQQFPNQFNYFSLQPQYPSTSGTGVGGPSTDQGFGGPSTSYIDREPSTHVGNRGPGPYLGRDINP
ncbi:agamous-like mads-box protein agl61 [Phtheirospermum japonicum]|uniref:Agamous-like mads-box protein agl61 n=1 Tax=Phtheirospermum japonicum TaxID=374723 RepID=A0A830BHX9_9LAMI|nr:agamous-like mads-box protein agl61 [Phtheirospermum japonicum]